MNDYNKMFDKNDDVDIPEEEGNILDFPEEVELNVETSEFETISNLICEVAEMNMRAEPDLKAALVTKIKNGDVLRELDSNSVPGWTKISVDRGNDEDLLIGWARSKFLVESFI